MGTTTRRLARGLALAWCAAALVVAPAGPADAHPLDEYLQSSYITIGPDGVELEVVLSPGVLVAPDVLDELDSDGDASVSDDEAQAYVARVLPRLTVAVDGEPLTLAVDGIDVPPYATLLAGYGQLRVVATAPLSTVAGQHRLFFRNDFVTVEPTYQANAFTGDPETVDLHSQTRDEDQRQVQVDYVTSRDAATLADANDVGSGADPEVTSSQSGAKARLVQVLEAPSTGTGALAIALALAVLLGALHALTPGHGKTLAAAYLVGSRGTVRHAIGLGGVVTFTHTISVIVLGVVALGLSHMIVPADLATWLHVAAGLAVLALGLNLVRRRWLFQAGAEQHPPDRDDDPRHGHSHGHGLAHAHPEEPPLAGAPMGPVDLAMRTHDHGDGRVHTHLPPERVTVAGLVTMGLAGGLVPCPEALGIMVLAVAVDHIALGLGMILAFSLGLALVLMGVGTALVKARGLLESRLHPTQRWSTSLPLISAVVVTLLGAGMLWTGLAGLA